MSAPFILRNTLKYPKFLAIDLYLKICSRFLTNLLKNLKKNKTNDDMPTTTSLPTAELRLESAFSYNLILFLFFNFFY